MKQRSASIIAALVFAALVACPAIAPAASETPGKYGTYVNPVTSSVLVAFVVPVVPVPEVPEVPVIPVAPVVPAVPEVPAPPLVPAPTANPVPSVTPATPAASAVPEALKPPAGQRLSLETVGIGVQIYECKPAKDDPKRYEWVFKAPEAELFDSAGKRIGRHYAGPTWEANDGSKVVGEIKG
ncbi:MAG: DUF3455 domain-containing protein, partial [Oryzomonas sp.]